MYASENPATPEGFTWGGRQYVKDNGVYTLFHAAHENAHNLPGVQRAIFALMNDDIITEDDFREYMRARVRNIAAKRGERPGMLSQEQAKTEFACDLFGAVMYKMQTEDNSIYERIGIPDTLVQQAESAVRNALAYDPEVEHDLDDTLAENDAACGNDDAVEFSDRSDLAIDPKSGESYTVESFAGLPSMNIRQLPSLDAVRNADGNINRARVLEAARESVRNSPSYKVVGGLDTVTNRYTQTPISVSGSAIRHGLDRRIELNAGICLDIGHLLENALPVNSYANSKRYVAIGATRTDAENLGVVFIINRASGDVEAIDVIDALHSINARKIMDPAVNNDQQTHQNDDLLTGSVNISIDDLLKNVYTNFSDVLSRAILENYGGIRAHSKYSDNL